jgi:hypothetical protein
MSLASDAVMLIYCDFDGDAGEHDHWHSNEHLQERLSIPGFLRGTRWARASGSPRYMILYEVAGAGIAASPAYLARLNDPSPWTASIMPRVRRMERGLCTVSASGGYGLGGKALSMRFQVSKGTESRARASLSTAVHALASRRGVTSAHLLEPGAPPPMTEEQALRGRDAGLGWVLLATGYDTAALDEAASEVLAGPMAEVLHPGIEREIYSMQHTVTAADAARRS